MQFTAEKPAMSGSLDGTQSGNLAPRLNVLRGEERLVRPDEIRAAAADAAAGFQQFAHRQRVVWPCCVVDAGSAHFRRSHHPTRQVAHVHKLHQSVGVAGREYVAPTLDARGPVGEAVRRVVRADDQSGAHGKNAAGQRGFGRFLAQHLERPVGFARDLLDSRVVRAGHGRVLVPVRRLEVRVGRDAGNERVVPDRTGQQFRRRAHDARNVAAGVYHSVEGPAAQGFQALGGFAVAAQFFHAGEQIGVVLPPVEQRDGVAARARGLHQMPPQKDRATEDEQVHVPSLRGVLRAWDAPSLSEHVRCRGYKAAQPPSGLGRTAAA